ncbi:hypothetical protein [Streptomyces spiramyceticus]|uniref:hypothetical protein n=1 Tax=Streptomyces spiramyceticus TaxID=299717 RepID=UPI00237A2E71|nr:hypothetical protein [Streptomyces spiramyceticus]
MINCASTDHCNTCGPAVLVSSIQVLELPGVIEVTDPAPIVAHPASYEAWAEELGVPFVETIQRAEQLAERVMQATGVFRITCLGGIVVCRS